LKSCDLLGGQRGCGGRSEDVCVGTVEGLVVFEHAEDGMEKLAHEGDASMEFGFAALAGADAQQNLKGVTCPLSDVSSGRLSS
jgi:hypothetical protein